jgi:carboxyl-terminal processing protease
MTWLLGFSLSRAKRKANRLRGNLSLVLAQLAMLALSSSATAQTAAVADNTKSDPTAYLNRALDEMQLHALRREAVDWPLIRKEAMKRAARAESTVDTYDAIRFALASLGDHHSSLHLTPALQALESQRKAARTSDPESNASPALFSPYVGRYEPEGHIEQFAGKPFALLIVPKCFPANDGQFVEFETKIQQIIAELDKSHPLGWIVDLRGNVGGNMWPMLAGVGPLLGESDDLGEFFDTNGHSVWTYRNGVAAESDNGKLNPYPAVKGSPYKLANVPNVAVLIDHSTGSSGEALAVAFRGRPQTRFFGEHTAGVSTVNEIFALSDGASLWLTIGTQADRGGKQYPDGLAPDELVAGGDKMLVPAQDPGVQAALRWLNGAQP